MAIGSSRERADRPRGSGKPVRLLHPGCGVGRDAGRVRRPPHRLQAGLPHAAGDERRHPQGAGRHPGPVLPGPGGHLRLRRRGAALPARCGAAGDLGARVAGHRVRCGATGHGPGVLPRRHLLPRGRDPARGARGHHPVAADRQLEALPPGRDGHPAHQRGAGARRRRRPDPRRAGHLPGARGQRAGAVRRQLRHRQPPGDGQRLPRGLRHDADPTGARLPADAARRPAGLGAGRRQ